ncbi:MAG: thiol peroxidase [Desulfobulbaceae bacterium]|nr:thiol peroxidase [Desulfobulbaceae bacterium]
MIKKILYLVVGVSLSVLLATCGTKKVPLIIDSGSVSPGSQVTRKGAKLSLTGTAIAIGQRLPVTDLVDARSMSSVDLHASQGNVLFLSIVPSIDTKVCEEQTHYLGEEGDRLPADVRRITISRDTPFAQKRFSEEAKLEDIQYLSDYKDGSFGRSVGLLIDDVMLLARAVILVDKEGIVQYIQVVPEITNLPDMEKAFDKAVSLAGQQ